MPAALLPACQLSSCADLGLTPRNAACPCACRPPPPPAPIGEYGGGFVSTAGDGSSASVACTNGGRIAAILDPVYGCWYSATGALSPTGGGALSNSTKAYSYVADQCLRMPSCSVSAYYTNYLPDPCVNTVKALNFTYVCGPPPPPGPGVETTPFGLSDYQALAAGVGAVATGRCALLEAALRGLAPCMQADGGAAPRHVSEACSPP